MNIIEIKHTDEAYPKRLLQIEKFPKTLYATGDISLLNKEHILGMVGSRKCSEYGRKVADIFARELSKCNITIISGLAIGIDAASHIGAIDGIRKDYRSFRMWFKQDVS